MATTTPNLGLTKPEYTEKADIGVINRNMEILDTAVNANSTGKIDKPVGLPAGRFLQTVQDGAIEWGSAASPADVAAATEAWQDENVAGGSTIAVDASLTVSGAAADAKVTGDHISDLKSAIQYKADSRYGGTEATSDITLTNRKGWSGVSGNMVDAAARAASSQILRTPDMLSITCEDGYRMNVMGNNDGAGNAATNVGSSTWISSVDLSDVEYKYLFISIKTSPTETDFSAGTTTGVVTIVKGTEILPYALQEDLEETDARSVANATAISENYNELKGIVGYKANKVYGGTTSGTAQTLVAGTGWNDTTGKPSSANNARARTEHAIRLSPDMKSLSTSDGYQLYAAGNDTGEGSAFTVITSTWRSSLDLGDIQYEYIIVTIRRSDQENITSDDLSNVLTLTRYTEVYPFALKNELDTLETKVDGNFGSISESVGLKSGTINLQGQEDGRDSRLISTDYYEIGRYLPIIDIPEGHTLMIAYYNSSYTWQENSSWMSESTLTIDDTYAYMRLVLRNNSHLSDDISDEIGVIDLVLHPKVMTNAQLTVQSKSEGNNPIETGGLVQVARIGWNVYNSATPPEQSIPSFVLAYDNGCRVMLADLRVTSDGTFVCRHDSDFGATLSTNTVRHADGSQLTEAEKAYTIDSMSITTLDTDYDFGVYKGAQYAGTKILRLTDFLQFCKVMNCTAMIETKVALTQQQTTDVVKLIKQYGLRKNIIWAEDGRQDWGDVTLPIISTELPDAIIHLRGGTGNKYSQCVDYAEIYASASKPVEIGFTSVDSITSQVIAELLGKNIDIAYSEVKYVTDLESMIESGLIYKIKSVASSYINLGEYFNKLYRES